MARANLRNLRVHISRDATSGDPVVQIAYDLDTSDGDELSRNRSIAERLSAAQRTAVASVLAAIEAAVKGAEGIA